MKNPLDWLSETEESIAALHDKSVKHDEAAEHDKEIRVKDDIKITLEEIREKFALVADNAFPLNPNDGDVFVNNEIEWVYTNGDWVPAQGLEPHEHMTPDAALEIDGTNVDDVSGAIKRYVISGFNAQTNAAREDGDDLTKCTLLFQNGTIPEVGLNGITAESLLKVIKDLYMGFQAGPFKCAENDIVIDCCNRAIRAIEQRYNRRKADGTEGTHKGN